MEAVKLSCNFTLEKILLWTILMLISVVSMQCYIPTQNELREPWENLFLTYANNTGEDQPAHLRSLISTFIVHCLDIIPLVSIAEISSLNIASVTEQDGLSLTWSQTPKTFSHDEAQIKMTDPKSSGQIQSNGMANSLILVCMKTKNH